MDDAALPEHATKLMESKAHFMVTWDAAGEAELYTVGLTYAHFPTAIEGLNSALRASVNNLHALLVKPKPESEVTDEAHDSTDQPVLFDPDAPAGGESGEHGTGDVPLESSDNGEHT